MSQRSMSTARLSRLPQEDSEAEPEELEAQPEFLHLTQDQVQMTGLPDPLRCNRVAYGDEHNLMSYGG